MEIVSKEPTHSYKHERMIINEMSGKFLKEIIKTNKRLTHCKIKTFKLVFEEPEEKAMVHSRPRKWWQFWRPAQVHGVKIDKEKK